LDSLIEIAKQGHAPIRAVCLIERARQDLQAYLDEIYQAEVSSAWSGLVEGEEGPNEIIPAGDNRLRAP